jgi:MFS family permease
MYLAAAAPALGILRGAPPPVGGGRTRGPASRVRRSLRASTVEGVFAELFTACVGPAVLTGFALHLGASAVEVGMVVALPQLAQAVQFPAAWATALFGGRRVAIAAVTLSRQALLPLAALPFLPLDPAVARGVLVACAALSAVLAVVGNNAWTAWMGELVPERLRGRYFGRRTAACTLGGSLAGVAVARGLDAAGGAGATSLVLAALALSASAVGLVTSALLARQHEPAGLSPRAPTVRDLARPFRDPDARRLVVYQIAWNGSVGLAGGYFTFHMLENLRAGFTVVALHAAGTAASRVLAAPLWGRAVDRAGARPVLAASSLAAAGLPLLWLATSPDVLWPIAIDAVLGGIAWGGHGIAAFAAPLDVGARRDRPFYLAAFATAGGLAFAVAAALGGIAAAAAAPAARALGGSANGLELVFVLSSAGRFASAFLAFRAREAAPASCERAPALRGAIAAVRGPFLRR